MGPDKIDLKNLTLPPEDMRRIRYSSVENSDSLEIGEEMNGLDGVAFNDDVAEFSNTKADADVREEEEVEKALDDLLTFMSTKNKTNNYSFAINDWTGGQRPTKAQRKAIDIYKREYMPADMYARMTAALQVMESDPNFDLQSYKTDAQLAKDILKVANVQGGSDPEFEKYVRSNKIVTNITKRHDKVMKRREELKNVTQAELDKKLSKKAREALKDYLNAHKNEDGNYDLSGLSIAIEENSGKDYVVNKHSDPKLSEINWVRVSLRDEGVKVSGKEGTDNLTREITKFCGYEVQKRDHTPSWLEPLLGLGNGAIAGGVAHVAAPQLRQIQYNKILQVNQNVVLHLPEGDITVSQIVDKVITRTFNIDLCKNLGKAVASGAISGLVYSALMDIIIGRNIDELSCVAVNDFNANSKKYTDQTKYIEHLKNYDDTGAYYAKLEPILAKYPADDKGNWDYNGYLNELRTMAGLNSPFNCEEMVGNQLYPDVPEPKPVDIEIGKSEQHWNVQLKDEVVEVELDENNLKPEDQIIFNEKAKSSSWNHLAKEVYNCSDDGKSLKEVFGTAKSIRILKLAQAITDGNYSLERMNDLYAKSIKGAANLKGESGFDYGTYYSVLMGNFPSSVKLPKVLAGVKRCDISEDEHELIAPKANTENAPAPAKGPAIGKGTVKTVKKGENLKADMYFYKDENGKVHEFDTKEERDAAVQEAEERTGKKAKEFDSYEEMVGEKPKEESQE